MKKLFLLTVVCFSLAGCASTPVNNSERKALPADRMLAFKEKTEINNAKIVVTRDSGFKGGACYYSFWVDGVLAARFDAKESATFYIPSGERLLRAGRDPQGKGMCALEQGNWTQIESIVDANVVKSYRLSVNGVGQPEIHREN